MKATNKKKQQTELTMRKIADASRGFFVTKGFNGTSIEDIVKATGCSAGNIYYHFKSKESLFLHLIEERDREWEETWKAKEPLFLSAADKLYGMAEHCALDQMNHPLTKAADEFFNNTVKDAHIKDRIEALVKGYVSFNRMLLQEGVDRGEFVITADVTGLAIVLDSLLLGLSQHARSMDKAQALAAYRLAIDVFLKGIAKGDS